MFEWWYALSFEHMALWGVAIVSTLLFALQMLLLIFGFSDFDADTDFDADGDADFDGDMDDGGMSHTGFFSFRNIVASLMGLSWGILMLRDWGWSYFPAYSGGLFIGLCFIGINIVLWGLASRLKSSGNMILDNAVGEEGTVSIRIPAQDDGGYGRVSIAFQSQLREVEAISNGGELKRGQRVSVVRTSGTRLVVEPIDQA